MQTIPRRAGARTSQAIRRQFAGAGAGPRVAALALLAALGLGGGGCFIWKQPAGSAERPTILDFEIRGTHAVSEGDLKDRLVTQASGRKYLIIPQPSSFDDDTFSNDKRRILRYYEERGYYKARITESKVLREGDPGKVRIELTVDEGPPVHVSSIEIPGLEAAPAARDRLKKLPLKKGDIFTVQAYDRTRDAIEQALTQTGWAEAAVSSHAQIDPNLDLARVTYQVEAGQRYEFGPVFVAGAAAIPRARIRREAELKTEPGTTFDSRDLDRTQQRVYDLGVFGGVRVSKGPANEEKKTIPTVVSVREAPFRTIRAGPGFSFQLSRWQVDVTGSWSHRNWLGGLRKLTLEARLGYAWLPTAFNAKTQGFVGLFSADFTQPEIFSHYIDLNVHTELERGRELAYDYFAERLRIGFPLRLGGRTFSFTPSFNLELYQLGGQIGTPDPNTGQQLQLSTCPGHDPNLCLLAYFEQRMAVDLRDDPINTTSGLYLSLSLQEGFSAFGSGATFFRVLPEARAFLPLGDGVVLAGRVRVGVITAPQRDDLPVVTLFASGGPNLMRGYYTRALAPTVLSCGPGETTCTNPSEYVPVGGAGLVEGNLELRYPIAGKLQGATFLDLGNVTFNSSDAFDLGRIQYAAGTGLRYQTPFGPVRLDVAARLPTDGGGEPGVEMLRIVPVPGSDRTRLEPTGQLHHAPIVSVHLSIGQAF